jgi:hypothetical protein
MRYVVHLGEGRPMTDSLNTGTEGSPDSKEVRVVAN